VLKDLICHVGAALGKPELIRLGSMPPPKGEPPILVADVRRLKNGVGFTPGLGLHEGLEKTIDWWRTHPPYSSQLG